MTKTSTVEALAAALFTKFTPLFLKELKQQKWGWGLDDARHECWVAAHDALTDFNPARGEVMPRAFFMLFKSAAASGFFPAGGDFRVHLAGVAGGDDPAEILEAKQTFEVLERAGLVEAAAAARAGVPRTQRRWVARVRAAAEREIFASVCK